MCVRLGESWRRTARNGNRSQMWPIRPCPQSSSLAWASQFRSSSPRACKKPGRDETDVDSFCRVLHCCGSSSSSGDTGLRAKWNHVLRFVLNMSYHARTWYISSCRAGVFFLVCAFCLPISFIFQRVQACSTDTTAIGLEVEHAIVANATETSLMSTFLLHWLKRQARRVLFWVSGVIGDVR